MATSPHALRPVIGRRRLVVGAAWAAPVLSIAAAAPAQAATGGCTTTYPLVVSGTTATWTDTTGAPVTLTYTTVVPLGSVFNTSVRQVGATSDTVAYQPTNATTYTFTNGGSLTSTAAVSAGGSLTWTATVTVPAGSSLTLATQAGPCAATAPSATVTVVAPVLDCPFPYPINCPF